MLTSLPRLEVLQLLIPPDVVKLLIRQRLPFLLACFQILDEEFELLPAGVNLAEGIICMIANAEHEASKTWARALFKEFDEDLAVHHMSVSQNPKNNKNKNIPPSSISRQYPQT